VRISANFKLVMCRQRKELGGAVGYGLFGLCVNTSLASTITLHIVKELE